MLENQTLTKSTTSFKNKNLNEKAPKPKIAKYIWGFILLLFLVGLGIFALLPQQNDEQYLKYLIDKLTNQGSLPAGEMKDYCHLNYVLNQKMTLECACLLDQINWDNPPLPEELPKEWEEIGTGSPTGRLFKHKIYGFEIRFDYGNPNLNPKADGYHDHWHRENPLATNQNDRYLTKNCQVVRKGHTQSHIPLRKKRNL